MRAARRRRLGAPAALATLLAALPARGLINPNYTVVDLLRQSGTVVVLRVSAPRQGRMDAEVVETLAGQAPADKELSLDFSEAEDLDEDDVTAALGGAKTALGVLCIQKQKRDGVVVGAIEIGIRWMGVTAGDGKGNWKLDADKNDLETVWGASARLLIPAIRYALKDPAAAFPVASAMTWDRGVSLGKLAGKAHGCLATEDGVFVLSDGGDRVFAPAAGQQAPVDVTDKLALTSRSRALAMGDFNADGRADVASWDGAKLRLLLRGADGRFAQPCGELDLPECHSLSAIGGGLAIGGAKGVTLLAPDGKGGLAVRGVHPVGAELGPGGVAVVGDFNDDGRPDVMQVFAEGLALHAGAGAGLAAPAISKLKTVKGPTAVVCGDYDADGRLDLAVGGLGGATVLSRGEEGQWASITGQTGELGAAIGQSEEPVATICPADINADGRQSIALFHPSASPGLYFSRGFACFGVARSLSLAETKLPAAEALGSGQSAGTLCDLNADGAADLLAVDRQGGVWAIFGRAAELRRFSLTIALAEPAAGPLTVTASTSHRALGARAVRPGQPVTIGLTKAGRVALRWKSPAGVEVAREVTVTGPARVKL